MTVEASGSGDNEPTMAPASAAASAADEADAVTPLGVSPIAVAATQQIADLGEVATGRMTVEEYINQVWHAMNPDSPAL